MVHSVELPPVYTVSKNETDVAHYNFNIHQPILLIFGGYVAETACFQIVICYPISSNNVSALPVKHMNPENCVFSVMLYTTSQ